MSTQIHPPRAQCRINNAIHNSKLHAPIIHNALADVPKIGTLRNAFHTLVKPLERKAPHPTQRSHAEPIDGSVRANCVKTHRESQ